MPAAAPAAGVQLQPVYVPVAPAVGAQVVVLGAAQSGVQVPGAAADPARAKFDAFCEAREVRPDQAEDLYGGAFAMGPLECP